MISWVLVSWFISIYILYQICLQVHPSMISQALVTWFISIYILHQICLASPSFNDISSPGILVHLYIYPIPDMSSEYILQWYLEFWYPGSSLYTRYVCKSILQWYLKLWHPGSSLYISYTRYVWQVHPSMVSQALVSWFISIYILYQICLASPSFNDTSSSGILVGYGMYTREESCLTTGQGPLKLHYCDQVTSFHV